MAYLMHIGFDNSSRLCRRIYYFEYKKVKYKLIQNNPKKWCDVLLTIIGDKESNITEQIAYNTAGEFLSALGWENNSKVKLWHSGGPGGRDFTLRKARCSMFTFPRVPFGGYSLGYDICRIPKIETLEQKTALALFREAFSSNNHFLSFLFFWQIFEVGKMNPIGWINKSYSRKMNKLYLPKEYMNRLDLKGRSLGHYLYDDCRNAIAHIRRKPTKTRLQFDTLEEDARLAISTRIIEEFAKLYIKDELNLKNSLFLVRQKNRNFPFYADEEYIKSHFCKIAYQRPPLHKIMKRRF